MPQIDNDRFESMAECYDHMAPRFVPRYDALQDEVIALLLAEGQPQYLLELGAGSGIFLEKTLKACPSAHAVWLDASEDFERVARRRLAPFADRVEFILCSLTDDWPARLRQPADAICSQSAIHHLESEGKRSVYRRCFEVLRPGGWFFNLDEMSTLYDDAYRRTLAYWVTHVERSSRDVPESLALYARAWNEKFDGWKKRNVENIGQPKQPGDDIHEGYVPQMRWLHEAGFVNVDLFVKFQLWSAIGGQKPLAQAAP
ncbi:MAG: class I SAM-dependent methyltransferase [Phycisphaerae bacterium]|nr:class I SAM-dependent methyltransferase [Phycisphaerae bacterium]